MGCGGEQSDAAAVEHTEEHRARGTDGIHDAENVVHVVVGQRGEAADPI
jgi:hypothetical protein